MCTAASTSLRRALGRVYEALVDRFALCVGFSACLSPVFQVSPSASSRSCPPSLAFAVPCAHSSIHVLLESFFVRSPKSPPLTQTHLLWYSSKARPAVGPPKWQNAAPGPTLENPCVGASSTVRSCRCRRCLLAQASAAVLSDNNGRARFGLILADIPGGVSATAFVRAVLPFEIFNDVNPTPNTPGIPVPFVLRSALEIRFNRGGRFGGADPSSGLIAASGFGS